MQINTLYNMDCMEGMRKFPDKYFDLAIVDPPYGIGESGGRNHKRSNLAKATKYKAFHGHDKEPPTQEYFYELFRISKKQIIWGANHFIHLIPFDSSCWIVWDKQNDGSDFADCELAWTSFKSAVRKYAFRWNGMMQGDMKNKEVRIHPTQKPVALYSWLLNNYAKSGDKILDTHVGSASSLIACYELGFDYIGFEIDTDYFNEATKRLEDAKSQTRIFDYMTDRGESLQQLSLI